MMKRFFLLALGACALVGNLKAEPKEVLRALAFGNVQFEPKDSTKTYPVHQLSNHDEEVRFYVDGLLEQKRECTRLLAAAVHAKGAEEAFVVQKAYGEISQQVTQTESSAKRNGQVTQTESSAVNVSAAVSAEATKIMTAKAAAGEALIKELETKIDSLDAAINSEANFYVDGGHLPEIGDLYDSAPMIKMYLQNSGYNDVSDAQVATIADYMYTNRIRHVSQLGQ